MKGTVCNIIRWIARGGSIVCIGMLIAFMFGGNDVATSANAGEIVGLMFFPGGVIMGLLVAFRKDKERRGAILAITSLLLFYVWQYVRAGHINVGPWFLVFTFPAFLFLIAWGIDRPTIDPFEESQ